VVLSSVEYHLFVISEVISWVVVVAMLMLVDHDMFDVLIPEALAVL